MKREQMIADLKEVRRYLLDLDALAIVDNIRAALESEEVVAEGLADPDALADYNADRQHMLTIFKVRALRTDKPIRIVAVKEEL